MLAIIIFILGICFGSFVNAFVYRFFENNKAELLADERYKGKNNVASKRGKKLSVVNGRSMCVHCKHQLSAIDLIPLFSWLGLGGKCRYCHKAISWQYPLVELLTAVLFIFSFVYWPTSLVGVYDWVIFSFWLVYLVGFMALTVFDLKWMLLPNKVVFSLLGVYGLQLGYMLVFGGLGLSGLLSVVSGAFIISCLFFLLYQVSGGKWIGGGDVKLAVLLGALVGGLFEAFLMLFVASLLGSVIGGGLLIASRRFKLKTQLPFGPYLMLATVLVVLFGASIIGWYKGLLVY